MNALAAEPTGTAVAVARVIEYARGKFAALPPQTTLELIEGPRPLSVPGAARYACGLLARQDKRLPMIDLDALLHTQTRRARPEAFFPYALVLAWQAAPGQALEQGAIGIMDLPLSVTVNDAAACDLPGDSELWPRIARACFLHGGDEEHPVPIIDTSLLFGSYHGQAAAG